MTARGIIRVRSEAWWDPTDRPLVLGGLAAIAAVCAAISVLLGMAAIDVWTGTIVFLVLVSASVPMFRWVARAEADAWLFKVLFSGLLVKFAASMVRYFTIFVIYDGSADSGRYHEAATIFAGRFRDGLPIHPIDIVSGFPLETQRIGDLLGGMYVVTGPSAYAGFFIFSFICFWGQILVVRGLRVAVPEADHHRFTLAVVFLPSLLFWPSSIGKEAIMIGCLGVLIYGGALLLAPRPRVRGAAFFAAGLGAVLLVRPHVALMSVGAMAVAIAVGTLGSGLQGGAASIRGRAIRVAALVMVLALASMAITQVGETFGGASEEPASTSDVLSSTTAQTAQGGSEFSPYAASSPQDLPLALLSVTFRPFPWEANSLNSAIAAAEGFLLAAALALSWRRVLAFPVLALQRPFLVFVAGYAVAFAIGFSYLANFGILTRQRTQMLPVVLVLFALPPVTGLRARLAASAAALSEGRPEPGGDTDPGAAAGGTAEAPALTTPGGVTTTA